MSFHQRPAALKKTSAQIASESALSRRLMMSMEPGSLRWRRVRDQIVEDNLGLARVVSARLAGAFGFHSPEDRQDALSEVHIALVLLVERWDPDRLPLAPALFFAARERLRAAQESGSGFGGAVLQVRNAKRVRREIAALEQTLQREPTDVEVVDSLNARVRASQMHPERSGALLTVDQVRMLRTRLLASTPAADGEDYSFAVEDLVASPGLLADCESMMFVSSMWSMLSSVDEEMAEVFAYRFGLKDPHRGGVSADATDVADVADIGDVASYATVCRLTGLDLGTVKMLLLRARKLIGEWIEQEAASSAAA